MPCPSTMRSMICASLVLSFTGPLVAEEASVAEGRNWSLHIRATSNGAEVMAVPNAKRNAPVKVCDAISVPTTRVFLSADDDIAVVETGSSSLGPSLSVFLLTEGSEYLELKHWDLTDALQKAYEKAMKPKKAIVKPCAHFVAWSADDKAALARWSGGSESWYAVVDFEKKSLSGSLERLNHRATR